MARGVGSWQLLARPADLRLAIGLLAKRNAIAVQEARDAGDGRIALGPAHY
jgi:hypothetical protein